MNRLEFIDHLIYYYAISLQRFIDIVCSCGFPEGLLTTDLPPDRNFSIFIQECRGLTLNTRNHIFNALSKDKPNSRVFRILAESDVDHFDDALVSTSKSLNEKGQNDPNGLKEAIEQELTESSKTDSTQFEMYVDPGKATKGTILEVLEALSELNRAAGGLGIEFSEYDGLVFSRQRVSP